MIRPITALVSALLVAFPVLADCYDQAGVHYGISPTLLRAIAAVESAGRLAAVGHNSDGSEDLCAMQINSQHLPTLHRYGITRRYLLTDLCTCVNAGAWILAGEIAAAGSTWRAIARYHTGPNPARLTAYGQSYADKVFRAYRALIRGVDQ